MIMRREEPYARAVVPDHKRIRAGTLRRIISEAGLTVDEFIALLSWEPHSQRQSAGRRRCPVNNLQPFVAAGALSTA
jgi:hypothetical protein